MVLQRSKRHTTQAVPALVQRLALAACTCTMCVRHCPPACHGLHTDTLSPEGAPCQDICEDGRSGECTSYATLARVPCQRQHGCTPRGHADMRVVDRGYRPGEMRGSACRVARIVHDHRSGRGVVWLVSRHWATWSCPSQGMRGNAGGRKTSNDHGLDRRTHDRFEPRTVRSRGVGPHRPYPGLPRWSARKGSHCRGWRL